jgi:hypothetical protein
MPTLTFSIRPDGLLVDVAIGLDANTCQDLLQTGQPIPPPIRARAAVDSAADLSAISPRLAGVLNLAPVTTAQTHTAAGPMPVPVFEISLSIVPIGAGPLFTIPHLLATELTHAAPGIEGLIGLNVLLQCIFTINGPAGFFSFTF